MQDVGECGPPSERGLQGVGDYTDLLAKEGFRISGDYGRPS